MSTVLLLKPNNETDIVLTYFLVDNIDVTIEKQSGGGSVNTTHLVAFQEQSDKCIQHLENHKSSIHEKGLCSNQVNRDLEDKSNVSLKYFLWLRLRHQNRFDQIIPNFPGWILQHRVNSNLCKTVLTCLPPIASGVTEFMTVEKYMNTRKNLLRVSICLFRCNECVQSDLEL